MSTVVRNPDCVERWPECEDGAYDPRCCRFPKSCSCSLRLREGDQPLPEVNALPFVQDAVIADIEERRQLGISRYGTALQPFNGRDALRDAYEEAIDLCMYLKQALIERDAKETANGD